jgi:predicted O-methyltransferase YrrM
MNIEHALAINGFMSEQELTYIAETARKSRCIVEIGSYQGRSARAWADNTEGIIFCVDTWRDGGEEDFDRNLSECKNVLKVKIDSRQAAMLFQWAGIRFDVVFIDADHDYANVKADILAWRPLLQPDGILCGHDFLNSQWPDVEKSVTELVPNFRVIESIWTTEGYK